MDYNAKAAAKLTGIPAATLRSWERRYGFPRPVRTPSGQRLYSEEDIEMVQKMADLLQKGLAASLAAKAISNNAGLGTEAVAESEADREQSEEYGLLVALSKVAAHFPNGSINIYDRDLRYLFADGLGLAAIGMSSADLVGRSLWELFPRDSVQYVAPYYQRAFTGESVVFELQLAGRTYSIAAGPLEHTPKGVQTIIAVAQDISAWRQPADAQEEDGE